MRSSRKVSDLFRQTAKQAWRERKSVGDCDWIRYPRTSKIPRGGAQSQTQTGHYKAEQGDASCEIESYSLFWREGSDDLIKAGVAAQRIPVRMQLELAIAQKSWGACGDG
jgi:hypothetical protein